MQSSVNRAGRYSTSRRHYRTQQRYADPLPDHFSSKTKLPARVRGKLRANTVRPAKPFDVVCNRLPPRACPDQLRQPSQDNDQGETPADYLHLLPNDLRARPKHQITQQAKPKKRGKESKRELN